jgi:hypothetical protein
MEAALWWVAAASSPIREAIVGVLQRAQGHKLGEGQAVAGQVACEPAPQRPHQVEQPHPQVLQFIIHKRPLL